MNSAVRKYLQEIGRKGGKAAKGSPARIEANRRAAHARWRRVHPVPTAPTEAEKLLEKLA